MKKIFCLILLCSSLQLSAQTTDYIISNDGMGKLKIGMTQADVEKLTGKKIFLVNLTDTISGSWQDTATIRYKNTNVLVNFQRQYTDSAKFHMWAYAMKVKSPLFKTNKGIGIGTDKFKIISAYENYRISIYPDVDENGKRLSTSTIAVFDDANERELIFSLLRNKVVSIEIGVLFTDEE